METDRSSGKLDEANKRQESMISTMKEKANLLMNMSSFNDAVKVYIQIIDMNEYNEEAWKSKAFLLEKLGRLNEAIHAYEFAMKLESDHTETLKKIEELKSQLTN